VLAAVLHAGIAVVQYRAKAGVDRALLARMHARTAQRDALLIVNDDLDAALLADGLHAGQEDLAELGFGLRERLRGRILGVSCAEPRDATAARALGADYIGIGPFNATASKGDAGPAIGPPGVAAVARAVPDLPVVAIGGIGLDDLAAVKASGAAMAAVISALVRDGDPEASSRALVERWAALP
jgi:thiamine-phosphate diphosphorylase